MMFLVLFRGYKQTREIDKPASPQKSSSMRISVGQTQTNAYIISTSQTNIINQPDINKPKVHI